MLYMCLPRLLCGTDKAQALLRKPVSTGSRFSVAHLVCGSQRPLCLQGAIALGGRWERFGYDLWGLLQTGSVAISLSGQAATRIV